MNERLARLRPYPFERLAEIVQATEPARGKSRIDLSIGEPKHAPPAVVLRAAAAALDTASSYPATRCTAELRQTIVNWMQMRYRLPAQALSPDTHVLPLNGTREGLFAIAQCLINHRRARPTVALPNPFYQIYEGATLLAGAVPVYVNCPAASGFLPEFDAVAAETWRLAECVAAAERIRNDVKNL